MSLEEYESHEKVNIAILQIDGTDTVVQAKFQIFNEITKRMYRVNLKAFMTSTIMLEC